MATTVAPANIPETSTSIGLAVYNGVWLGGLLALALALVLLSTKQQRRGPIFVVQCIAFPMAFCSALMHVIQGGLTIVAIVRGEGYSMKLNKIQVYLFYSRREGKLTIDDENRATKFFEIFTPLICDVTLIFKVMSFYPSTLYTRTIRRFATVIPLIVIALCRAAMCSLAVYGAYDDQQLIKTSPTMVQAYTFSLFDLIEYLLQFIFCLYASFILFRKLLQLSRSSSDGASKRYPASSGRRRKLRFLIEATAMTFLLPIIAQIGAIISGFLSGVGYVFFADSNVFLSVVCSVLATSWSTIRNVHQHVLTADGHGQSTTAGRHSSSQRPLYSHNTPDQPAGQSRTDADDGKSDRTAAEERIEAQQTSTIEVFEDGRRRTLLGSIFDEFNNRTNVHAATTSFAPSEAIEMLTSTVHRQSQVSGSSCDDVVRRFT